MLRSLVEYVAYPSVVVLAACFCGALPGFLLCWQSAEGAGAQGDIPVFGVSSCPRPLAPVLRCHQFHVSEDYHKNLIRAIRFHLDILISYCTIQAFEVK